MLITVDKFLYQKISFFLINLILLFGVGGAAITILNSSIFIEWMLGGRIVNFSLTILLDRMRCFFLAVVLCISSNVVWFRKSYISNDPNANRFILLVLGFVVSIIILIVRPNIFRILLGWDGLGLISYCLVVYYPSRKSRRAGIITVLSNRVGDVCILVSIAWFMVLGDFNFVVWSYSLVSELSWEVPFLVIVAAITKRAQIPFSAWLPAAIAAPTPVSALVHSSTLVTAGVYLLIRYSFLLGSHSSQVLLYISVITIFISGVVAIFEYDLKKIIALSTLSQLGIMIFSISLGLYQVAFFHLLRHALFKALLFLCAGILIHGVGDTQDVRGFGGLVKNFPLVRVCINLANFSLCGIPFLAGFYSKDLIVELACQSSWGVFILGLIFVCLGLTVFYSVRLTFLGFVAFKGGIRFVSICESDYCLTGPVCLLTLISLLSGPSLIWVIFPFPVLIFLPLTLKLGAIFVVLGTLIVRVASLQFSFLINSKTSWASSIVGLMWYLPWVSGQGISISFLRKTRWILKLLDQGWLEFYSGKIVQRSTNLRNSGVLKFQSNALKLHFTIFLVWILLRISYLICFYSLKLKHSAEDARIIIDLKTIEAIRTSWSIITMKM